MSRDGYEHEALWDRWNTWGNYGQDKPRVAPESIWYPKEGPDELWRAMETYLASRNLDVKMAVDLFNWYPAEYHGPRIIIPCVRTDSYNFWQGRLIGNDTSKFKRWDSPSGPRGDAVCFLDTPGADYSVVVEGPMCALAAAMEGMAAVAVLGLGMNKAVLGHVVKLVAPYKAVFVIPDKGAWGQWTRAQGVLSNNGISSFLIDPAPYKDLAEMSIEQRKEKLRWAKTLPR